MSRADSISDILSTAAVDTTAAKTIYTPHTNTPCSDSIAADSASSCPEPEMVLDTISVVPARPASYLAGHQPATRPYNPATDSAILSTYAVLLLLLAFNLRHLRRVLTTGAQELLSVRDRDNVFDEHTASESRAGIILVCQLCLSAAIIIYFAISARYDLMPDSHTASTIFTLTGVCAGYYLFQLGAYSIVGYAFAPSPALTSQWIKGFRAGMAYLSPALLVPALVALFYPEAAIATATISLVLFCLVKLIFIIKGFRIFYYNILSLLYLFLYLCSLEIIPVLLVYSLSLRLMGVDGIFVA